MNDPYLVVKGDKVASVAKRAGLTVNELRHLNHLQGKETLAAGQTLYLSERTSFGFTTLFLDALRHPIENLPYQLRFDNQVVAGKTPANGMVPRKVTKNAKSAIEVWVQSAQGQWQQLIRTASDHGHKLITLVSGAVVVAGKTEAHPAGVPTQPTAPAGAVAPARPSATSQAAPPKPASGAPSKNNKAVKTKTAKTPQGQPVLQISVDIPKGLLDHFAKFTGGEITDKDWKDTADALTCDEAVLKAISVVESGGNSSFWLLNKGDGAHIPAILFERHYFSRKTKGIYDDTFPDVSWPTGYRTRNKLHASDKKMPSGEVEERDIYSDRASAYLRLIEAYRLDEEAALKSCSWGKFQVMGDNFAACGAEDLDEFVNAMCTSEYEQLRMLSGFIRKKPRLWAAVKTRDWEAIALNYNGPGYKTFSYDTKLKAAYEKFASPPKDASDKKNA
jgi:LysM repeat protein